LAANLLFAVRLLPLGLASLVTVGFVLPAFVEFEPNSTSEGLSARLVTLAIAGALVLIAMAVRGAHILLATYQTQMQWMARSEPIYVHGVKIPVRQVEGRSSLLAVTGILRPRIFIAREIVERLSAEELAAALAHEMAHVSSFDNLKQLLLRITRPPGFLKTLTLADAAWTSASEVAADQSALTAGATALDLSSALVKVGRIGRPTVLLQAVTASHLLPSACGTSLEARVQRLQEALEQDTLENGPPSVEQTKKSGWRKRAFSMAVLVILAYSLSVPVLLPAIHEVLELLVR
jgi:Zn-dependent protease with chaperone function